ncbi:myb-like transcription factor family protein isoform X2 [Wolffia australiana]
MTRRCSHCSHNGHNSRTCPNRGVKLFGVRLTDGSIRKSASMGNLSHYAASSGGGGGSSPAIDGHETPGGAAAEGYASEDFVPGSSSGSRERKKGIPWTEDEHRMFLLGLKKLGKGDWRGISRNFVVSRTPTQVASHAQKYFIRQTNASRRKRRSSLFDIIPDELQTTSGQEAEAQEENLPGAEAAAASAASASVPIEEDECESMSSTNSAKAEADEGLCHPVIIPAYFSPFFPLPFPVWPTGYGSGGGGSGGGEGHEIVRPTAVHSKAPINVEELVGISKLTLGETAAPSLSLKLAGGPSRQSAFHANSSSAAEAAAATGPDVASSAIRIPSMLSS